MNLKENSLEKSKMIANEIKNSLEEKNIFHLRDIIYDTNEVTLANIFEQYFDIKEILFMFKVIKKEKSSEIFAYLPQNMKQQVINGLQDHEIKVMLDYMFTDDISEFEVFEVYYFLEEYDLFLEECEKVLMRYYFADWDHYFYTLWIKNENEKFNKYIDKYKNEMLEAIK